MAINAIVQFGKLTDAFGSLPGRSLGSIVRIPCDTLALVLRAACIPSARVRAVCRATTSPSGGTLSSSMGIQSSTGSEGARGIEAGNSIVSCSVGSEISGSLRGGIAYAEGAGGGVSSVAARVSSFGSSRAGGGVSTGSNSICGSSNFWRGGFCKTIRPCPDWVSMRTAFKLSAVCEIRRRRMASSEEMPTSRLRRISHSAGSLPARSRRPAGATRLRER